MDIIGELTLWHWFILGAALIVIEMLAPGVVFLWLGLAALATGLVVAAAPSLGWEIQLLAFAAFAAVAIYAGRRFVAARLSTPTDHPSLNARGRDYIGRTYALRAPIVDGTGKLVIDDTSWTVNGPDLPEGAHVRITGMDGMILTVERAN